MGQLKVDEVIRVLQDAGYAAEYGFPQGKAPDISGPVCAVNLRSADLTKKRMAVTVRVLCPMELGAGVCEQTAMAVGEILSTRGGQCTLAPCSQNGAMGLFSVEVTAVYAMDQPDVTIDGSKRRYARTFCAWKTLDEVITDWGTAPWQFEMEEWFPAGEAEQLAPEGTFTLVYTADSGVETFTDATWSYRKREWTLGGVRQIRRGMAASRSFSRE